MPPLPIKEPDRISIYRQGAKPEQAERSFAGEIRLKIVNDSNHCDFLVSADGKTWATLVSKWDVSKLNHNELRGFLALRPTLVATGQGEVAFRKFVYRVR